MSIEVATAAIVARLRGRLEELATSAVERYRAEISDYAAADDRFVHRQVYAVTVHNIEVLLDNIERGTETTAEQLRPTLDGAARRAAGGISLDAIQQAYRLFGEHVWAAILEVASIDDPDEREAALRATGFLMRHVNLVSAAGTRAYLDEFEGVWSDREIVRRDLLEALLAGRGAQEATRRDARAVGVPLHADYAVVVGRALDGGSLGAGEEPPGRRTLRHGADIVRAQLPSALVGLREREIVALCPASSHADMEGVRQAAVEAATALADSEIAVGICGGHVRIADLPEAYSEAREAAAIAARTGVRGRAVGFDEVLLDLVLRSSPHAARIVSETIAPLREYDARRKSRLVDTLQTYLDTGFNVTRSAQLLHVHGNTVTYRLDRIKTLTGRDPRNADDLIFLALGLKMG